MAAVDQATRNEAAARRWVEEVMNRRNAAVVDELMAPDYEHHALFYNPYIPSGMQGESWLERVKHNIDKDMMGLEHRHTSINQLIAGADKVVAVMTTTGTRKGKQLSYSTVAITRFADGKMVEGWQLWDRLGVYQQLGMIAPTPDLIEAGGAGDVERRGL